MQTLPLQCTSFKRIDSLIKQICGTKLLYMYHVIGLCRATSKLICNGYRTEWSPIQSVFIRVHDNKIERPRAAGVRFVISRVWLQSELDDTKFYYQLIIKKYSFRAKSAEL